jgi:hypothetical protein
LNAERSLTQINDFLTKGRCMGDIGVLWAKIGETELAMNIAKRNQYIDYRNKVFATISTEYARCKNDYKAKSLKKLLEVQNDETGIRNYKVYIIIST